MPPPSPAAWREASPDGRAPPRPKQAATWCQSSPDGRAQSRPKRPIKRYRRFPYYDYSRGAALFITISTSPRAALFGRVVEAKMELSPLGSQVIESIEAIPRFNPGFALHGHVVMPDHVHFNLWLPPRLPEPVKALGTAIRRFKTWTTTLARKQLGAASLWQQGCHDRICTSERFIDSTERYIAYNPLKWELGKNQPEFLRVREPLDSPRLDPAEYWRGVGNIDLLDPKQKILSLRVSRRVKDFGRLLSRMRDAVQAGYAILSGFISPGELAVRDMLLADPAAKLIRVLPERMEIGHRPESRYLPAIQERRYLEIAEGNEPTGFSRAACLDLNAAIVSIATEGEGLAVYWKPEGPTLIGEDGASPSGLPASHCEASPDGRAPSRPKQGATWCQSSPDGQAPSWPKRPATARREASPDGRAPPRPKREWREKARALRTAHAGDPAGPDPAPAVLADPAWRGARTVGLYLRQGPAEPDTAGLLAACRREGKAVAVPAWAAAAKAYFWAALAPDEALAAGPMGIPQPAAPRRVGAAAVDLFVVPGLLFDETGTRLGHGAGHIDRLLAGRRPAAAVLGLAFPWQVLPPGARLPREATDVPADRIAIAPLSSCPGSGEGV